MPYRDGFSPLVEETAQVAWDDLGALEHDDRADRRGARRGVRVRAGDRLGRRARRAARLPQGVQELCRRHGIVTIADVVIGGFGRLGDWLAVERFGLEPDLIVFAKGVTSGTLPLGGVIAAPRIAEPFWAAPGRPDVRPRTDLQRPSRLLRRGAREPRRARAEGLVERTRAREAAFHATLSALAAHPLVGEVRGGVGLMAAVALEPERSRPTPTCRDVCGRRRASTAC